MVNPMYLIALFLAAAFLIALVDKLHRKLSIYVLYGVLATAAGAAFWQLKILHLIEPAKTMVFSAGFPAPLSIALSFGYVEAILLLMINIIGLLGAIYLYREFEEHGAQPIALYLLVILGANGLVLTRDIFNTFVFMEILSIATYALVALQQNKNSLIAGIKYMLAGGLSSSVFLIGVVFAYRYTGTLNIDTWISLPAVNTAGYQVAMFLVAMGVFLELKPFPANGWALDLYQSTHSGIAAIVSTVNTGALLYLFYKIMPLFSPTLLAVLCGAGLLSFVMANLLGIRQKSAKRLLGYSSTAQTGLIIFALGALYQLNLPAGMVLLTASGILLTNLLAKAVLFWLSGTVGEDSLSAWSVLRNNDALLAVFSIAVIALMGFPPFPGFFAKWQLIQIFGITRAWVWMAGLLLGSLFEVVYLMRWLGMVYKDALPEQGLQTGVARVIPNVLASLSLVGVSLFITRYYPELGQTAIYPIIAFLLFSVMDFLPTKLKGLFLIALLGYYGWFMLLPMLPLMGQIFIGILIGGSIVQVFGFMHHESTAKGMFPALVLMIFSLGNVVVASSKMELFLAWELMTLASYFLILRGKRAKNPALNYIVFSTFGAYLLLVALAMMPNTYLGYPLILQAKFITIGSVAGILAAGAFLIKMGAVGVHYWLPGAYAEADDDSSSLLSSVLSKAGVYGLLLVLIMFSKSLHGNNMSMGFLGWIGVLTAFFGALMAAFQEDAKKLLAYSSMSQMGYIIAGLSLMSHLGWVSAVYLAVNHLFFKGLIFMAMAGVFLRTGTRNMYEMGGLIKKMPIAFVSVLIGIIAVSGVPPLSGFGSKWFIYTSLLEQGRYLQAGLAFFSSAIAFLYLYKLIHAVFLGQAKPYQYDVKEAPVWLIIPQVLFMMAIMVISMFPNLITKPLSMAVANFISKPDWLSWDGYNVVLNSPILHANWNGNLIMYVTMGVFIVPLVWLLLVNAKTQKVKQFNIVFAAERPYKPWTTHYAYNMFAPYNKALGFLVKPRVTAFYNGVAEWTHSIAATISRIYTGNGQTYVLHIFLYMLFIYSLLGVK